MKDGFIHETVGGLFVSNPEVLGGKPVLRGTRKPVSTLFESPAEGLSPVRAATHFYCMIFTSHPS